MNNDYENNKNQNEEADFNDNISDENTASTAGSKNEHEKAPDEKADENISGTIVYGEQKAEDSYNYRWNDAEYRSEIKNRSSNSGFTGKRGTKHNGKPNFGLKAFCVVLAAVFVLSFASVTALLAVNYFKNGVIFPSIHSGSIVSNVEDKNSGKDSSNYSAKQVLSVPEDTGDGKALTISQIAEKCTPSAVGVCVTMQTNSFGYDYTSEGVGSGFILTSDGYIATNFHVVNGATKIKVVLNDKREFEAKVIGTDTLTDIAVIKIDAKDLPVAELGNSDNLAVGELAVAIGTPASITLAGTVTDGIISAFNRDIEITDSYGRVTKTMSLIQTNATINPGNSGGPLINSQGKVIGINTLKLTEQFEGIGFAIPINGAIKIINQLISDGKVSDREDSFATGRPVIGVQGTDISESQAKYYDIPRGVLVTLVGKGSNAEKAGLRRGDIITKYNGEEVVSTEQLNALKDKNKVGDNVKLTVYRDGEANEIEISFALQASEN